MGDYDKQMEHYIKNELYKYEEKTKQAFTSLEEIKYINTYTYMDYVFPFHMLLKTNEKAKGYNVNYSSTNRYYLKSRYDFMNLLNKKFDKCLTNNEKTELKQIEEKYFYLNCLFYGLATVFLILRPIKSGEKKFKLLNLYIGATFFFSSINFSMYFVKNQVLPIKKRVENNRQLSVKMQDLFDYTNIPDWRTYLYYYGYL